MSRAVYSLDTFHIFLVLFLLLLFKAVYLLTVHVLSFFVCFLFLCANDYVVVSSHIAVFEECGCRVCFS